MNEKGIFSRKSLSARKKVLIMSSDQVISAYAACSMNQTERLASSSGGIFSVLAREILSKGGIVYGAAMSADCRRAEFIRATDEAGLEKLRGSKYLQVCTGNAFKQVRDDLEKGLTVLFSGTGCQVNGLKGFLGIDNEKTKYPNLYCVDVVCHGTPSPAIWREYVNYVEDKNGSHLVGVNFRCKSDSWTNFGMREIDDTERSIYISKDKDPYMLMFLKNYSLRPSCYECKAKEIKLSDLTIADFWGIDSVAPEMNDGKGTSLVMIRTEEGRELLESIHERLKLKQVSYMDGVKCNPAEFQSVSRPKERDLFFVDMQKMSFEELRLKYGLPSTMPFKRKVKAFIKKVLIKAKIIGGGGEAKYR